MLSHQTDSNFDGSASKPLLEKQSETSASRTAAISLEGVVADARERSQQP
jgi:hypothetical protein